jgi:hypothetical protein
VSVKLSVSGVNRLARQLAKRKAGYGLDQERAARVFYTAPHAVMVHEDFPTARRPTQFKVGGPKYLETPLRTKRQEISRIVYEALKKGYSLGEALLRGARYLREESQKVCPYDTGELHDSAGERLEE